MDIQPSSRGPVLMDVHAVVHINPKLITLLSNKTLCLKIQQCRDFLVLLKRVGAFWPALVREGPYSTGPQVPPWLVKRTAA